MIGASYRQANHRILLIRIDERKEAPASPPEPPYVGSSWTTDAPFRETVGAIAAARSMGVLAVEIEAAALYAFARRQNKAVLCLAHVANTMGLAGLQQTLDER